MIHRRSVESYIRQASLGGRRPSPDLERNIVWEQLRLDRLRARACEIKEGYEY